MKIKLPKEISLISRALLLSLLLFIIDRVFKLISLNSDYAVINPGIAFGLFPGSSLILMIVGLLFLITIRLVVFRWGIVLIFIGGLSNLLDRIFYNGVVDYIRPGYIFPDFNIADVLIIAGSLMMGWQVLHSRRSGADGLNKPQLPL